MTISGTPPAGGGAGPAGSRVSRAYGLPPQPSAPAERAAGAGRAASAPAAPGGNGDSLRAILTDEERAYFDQIASLGPISYGPVGRAAPAVAAPRGLRLDVRG